VQYPIPGNDDAIRSVGLLTRIIADAAAEGLIQKHQAPEGPTGNVSAVTDVEPLAEWERELLEASAPAVAEEVPAAEAVAEEATVAEAAETPAEESAPEESPAAEAPEAKKPARKTTTKKD
ncbi:MAG: 30S ribosomal protein S2, partial [Microbacteriaceae bacterium]|nr:30S ribosomal protein S2 [Microbacteriaceae bacterium]